MSSRCAQRGHGAELAENERKEQQQYCARKAALQVIASSLDDKQIQQLVRSEKFPERMLLCSLRRMSATAEGPQRNLHVLGRAPWPAVMSNSATAVLCSLPISYEL